MHYPFSIKNELMCQETNASKVDLISPSLCVLSYVLVVNMVIIEIQVEI